MYFCLDCQLGQQALVENAEDDVCSLLPSASGEVVRLWKMAKAVVLRRIFIVFFIA